MKKICFIPFIIDSVVCLILSKSNIQMCENRGLSGQGDPQNLVDGKSCEKKMVVLMSVTNNQKEGTEKLHATVSRVRDGTSNEYARLYNPFMITISKSPVMIIYPYFYTGFSVNNLPYEEVRNAKGSWYVSDSSKSCYDQWQSVERDELKPTCGYQYITKTVVQPDGTQRVVKSRIRDSQGFCCHCTGEEKLAYTAEEAQNYKRSGITCKSFTSSSQASGHCMRMDDLWYTVHEFTESYRDFSIHIKAYDQVEKVLKNKTVMEYVNGGEIVLSPSQKSGVGKYQRIIAHYIGDFAPVKSFPVLSERYLLIPRISPKIDPERHVQVKDGPSKYLILPMSFFDLRGGRCNAIGVSYSSFKNQANSGKGYGCSQKKGYCLANQPFHYFKEAEKLLNAGKNPLWFPSRYGNLAGVKKRRAAEAAKDTMLSYVLEEDHVSVVTLQISADDIIFIYNRATGEIVRAAIRDFEALSLDGKLQVEIQNTGYVTASFYVGVPACSDGIHKVEERSTSIDPQQTQKFVFSLKTTKRESETFTCTIQLFDAKRALLSQRNISFSTTTPCTCEVMACKCQCSANGGVSCVEMEGKSVVSTKLYKVNKAGGMFDSFSNFFKGVANLPGKIFSGINNMFSSIFGPGLWKYLRWAGLAIIFGFCVCIFIQCGGLQMIRMCIKTARASTMKRMKKEKRNEEFSDDAENPPSYEEVFSSRSKKTKEKRKQSTNMNQTKRQESHNKQHRSVRKATRGSERPSRPKSLSNVPARSRSKSPNTRTSRTP